MGITYYDGEERQQPPAGREGSNHGACQLRYGPKDLETQVTVCNIRPAFNKEWVRVQFKVSPEIEQIAKIIESAFLKAGGRAEVRYRPKGPP